MYPFLHLPGGLPREFPSAAYYGAALKAALENSAGIRYIPVHENSIYNHCSDV